VVRWRYLLLSGAVALPAIKWCGGNLDRSYLQPASWECPTGAVSGRILRAITHNRAA